MCGLQWAVTVVDEVVKVRNWPITVECKKNSWLWLVNFLLHALHNAGYLVKKDKSKKNPLLNKDIWKSSAMQIKKRCCLLAT